MATRSGGGIIPEGFEYIEDFLTESEQAEVMEFCRAQDLGPFTYQGRDSNRRVKNFGVNFDYDHKVTFIDTPIPDAARWLLQKVADQVGIPEHRLGEMLVTEYSPGAGINWHRDSRPFESVMAISLENAAPLQLRPAVKRGEPSPITTVNVGAGSLYVLDGVARTGWMHRVPPVKQERWSITIRTLRPQWDPTVGSSTTP